MVERGTGKAASTTARRADRADHTHGRLPGRAVLERARPEPVVLDLHAGRDRRSERLHPAEVPGDHEQLYRDAAVGRAHLPVLRHRDQRGWRKWTVQCGQWYATTGRPDRADRHVGPRHLGGDRRDDQPGRGARLWRTT